VRAVTLFSSGVCYTLREGEIAAGEALTPLTFRTGQINDILKSLVLLDPDGEVRAAAYPSRDPIQRTLQAFAVDVRDNLSRADLLRQLRGAAVTLETTVGETLTGRIVGMEDEVEALSDGRTIARECLILLGEEGVQMARLDRVRLLRLLDARLDREFREALVALAANSDDSRRTLTLRFSGAAKRSVRVGYIVESPVWKVSYRLVLPTTETDEAGRQVVAAPYLQGWALVENTSDDDWNDVRLSLVSGRPISFLQDLYQPLYVPRPVVRPDIAASPYPQTHGADLGGDNQPHIEMESALGGSLFAAASAPAPAARHAAKSRAMAEAMPAMASGVYGLAQAGEDQGMAIYALQADSVPAQAEGKAAGELFAYTISEPVTLPRQQGAMIPIVSDEIEGEKLSLYNSQVEPRFPLNAVRLKNNTALYLKAGPVTIFDGGIYAGDARMEDIPPSDTRLLTYAVDLAVECAADTQQDYIQQTNLAIRSGVLQIVHFVRRECRYKLKSKAAVPRQVLVEHPIETNWRLVEPAAVQEQAWDRYRFSVSLTPNETRTLTVTTERTDATRVALINGDLNALEQWTLSGAATPLLKERLGATVARRRAVQALMARAAECERQRSAIFEDQNRIRQNLAALDQQAPLYRRYLEELDRQETQLQTLREDIERLRAEADQMKEALTTELDELEID
jgi:hypothetical protein